jgi:hypothetical protein
VVRELKERVQEAAGPTTIGDLIKQKMQDRD